MKTRNLEKFVDHMKTLETEHQITDVLELLPEFEQLEIEEWSTLLGEENGEPCTTPLYESDQLKMLLIYWKANQTSSVHGHPGGGGLIKVLSGSLEESRYDPEIGESLIDECQIMPGNIGFIHDMFAWHKVRNPCEAPAVSLHLYSLVPAEEYI